MHTPKANFRKLSSSLTGQATPESVFWSSAQSRHKRALTTIVTILTREIEFTLGELVEVNAATFDAQNECDLREVFLETKPARVSGNSENEEFDND